MATEAANELLGLARSLERRDSLVADELAVIAALAERAEAVRGDAARAREALESLPGERESLLERGQAAERDLIEAMTAKTTADAHVAALETSRRGRREELDRARKEAATAGEAVEDASARVARLVGLRDALAAEVERLTAEETRIGAEARAVADELRASPRVAESTTRSPGAGLAALEEWGSQVRSALFVARGILEQERERIVEEANALGSSVLGESLGASSVSLVRQRLEERA